MYLGKEENKKKEKKEPQKTKWNKNKIMEVMKEKDEISGSKHRKSDTHKKAKKHKTVLKKRKL